MNKVFVVQDTDRNITPAKEYGELRVMLTYGDISKGYSHVLDKLKRMMATVTKDDYLVCIGDPIAIGLAVHVALTFTNGQINILKWDRERWEYKKSELRTI